MRTVVVFLLLANIAYSVWHFRFDNQDGEASFVRSPSRRAPESLVLVGESGLQQIEPGFVSLPDLDGITPENGCLELGLFEGLSLAAEMTDYLQELGFPSYVHEREVLVDTRYWVLMPPFNSDIALERRMAELSANNISSSQIIGGELDRGISLGIFVALEEAESIRSSLVAQGYATEMRKIDQTETEIKVVVEGLPNRILGSAQWQEFLEFKADLEVSEKLCETIAP